MLTALVILIAISLDLWLGEPRKYHPLVLFGQLANKVEHSYNGWQEKDANTNRALGTFALLVLLLPLTAVVWLLSQITFIGFFVSISILYFAIGLHSLRQHSRKIFAALEQDNLPKAQIFAGHILSRDTEKMNSTEVACATIESTLENGNDAVFGVLFWFAVAGAPGALLYRLANTLDAMWGYKTHRFQYFGWAAARLDDWLNWIPARLCALFYCLLGQTQQGFKCWSKQAKLWPGINPGAVITAGAGALGVKLGGDAYYQGCLRHRIVIGDGREPCAQDIQRSIQLTTKTNLIWALVLVTVYILFG